MPLLALAAVVLLVVAFVAVALQVALPRIAAARVRSRLTEGGGYAVVSITAFPGTRLLRDEGDRLEVRGSGLEIGLAGGDPGAPAGIAALDGFADVDIELTDFRAGPFSIAAFVLARTGGESYAMATQGTIAGSDLIRLAEGVMRLLPVGPLAGALARGATPLASLRVPISVETELISEGGRLRVGAGGGSIAGYPAGPVVTAIAAAVAGRLAIAPD